MCIVFLGVILRLFFFAVVEPWDPQVSQNAILVGDARGYHEVAVNLLESGTYDSLTSQFRTPGYPFFIALIYFFFGIKPWMVILVQIGLTVCMIFLVHYFGRWVFDETIGLLAAALFAVNPLVIYYATTILTETLFSLVFLASLLFLIKGLIEERHGLLVISGFLLGISTLIKPITQFFPVIITILIAVWPKRRISFRLKGLLGVFLVFYLTLFPWLARNYLKYHHFKLTSFQGYNLLFYNAAAVEKAKTGESYKQIIEEFNLIAEAEGVTVPGETFANYDIYNRIAVDYIFKNLAVYIPLHLKGMALVFLDVGIIGMCKFFGLETQTLTVAFTASNRSIFGMIGAYFTLKPMQEIFFSMPFYLLLMLTYGAFFMGAYAIFKMRRYEILLFVLLIMFYFTFLPGVIGQARYRIPIIPLYLLVSSVGINTVVTYLKRSKTWKTVLS